MCRVGKDTEDNEGEDCLGYADGEDDDIVESHFGYFCACDFNWSFLDISNLIRSCS